MMAGQISSIIIDFDSSLCRYIAGLSKTLDAELHWPGYAVRVQVKGGQIIPLVQSLTSSCVDITDEPSKGINL